MFCPECGKEIPDVSKVCGFCGFRLPVPQETVEDAPVPAPVPEPPPAVEASPQPREAVQPSEATPTPPVAQEPAPPPKAPVAEIAPTAKPGRKLPGWTWGAVGGGALVLVVISLFAFGVIDLNGKSSASPPLADSNGTSSESPTVADSESASSSSVFVGEWRATDVDGSAMSMTIVAGSDGSLTIEGYDAVASGGCDGNPAWIHGELAYFKPDGNPVFTTEYSCDEAFSDIIGPFEVAYNYMANTDQIEEETQEGYPSIYWDRVDP
jgi:hypothetical protein